MCCPAIENHWKPNKGELNETTIAVMRNLAGRNHGSGAARIIALVQSVKSVQPIESIKQVQSTRRFEPVQPIKPVDL